MARGRRAPDGNRPARGIGSGAPDGKHRALNLNCSARSGEPRRATAGVVHPQISGLPETGM
jgi:hypothetical protein